MIWCKENCLKFHNYLTFQTIKNQSKNLNFKLYMNNLRYSSSIITQVLCWISPRPLLSNIHLKYAYLYYWEIYLLRWRKSIYKPQLQGKCNTKLINHRFLRKWMFLCQLLSTMNKDCFSWSPWFLTGLIDLLENWEFIGRQIKSESTFLILHCWIVPCQ